MTEQEQELTQEQVEEAAVVASETQGASDNLEDDGGLKTEVTSIAEEEKKTGIKVETPNAQEMVARASASLMMNKKQLQQLCSMRVGGSNGKPLISRKGMTRILLSILDLPTEDVIVGLKNDYEKQAFGIGQRLIADRFIITQHHISEQIKQAKAEEAKKASETEEQTTPEGGEENEEIS